MPRLTAPILRGRVLALAAVAAGLVALACNDASEPQPIDAYPYKVVIRTDNAGFDSLAFHWSSSALPVRFWAEDAGGLPTLVRSALDRWETAAGSSRFRGTLVGDSTTADVIVQLRYPPTPEFAVRRLGSLLARDCEGAADILLTPETKSVAIPMHIYVFSPFEASDPRFAACMDPTTTHEVGHTLGLFVHSPNSDDVMYRLPNAAVPSYRDRATVQILYRGESDFQSMRP